MQSTRTPSCTTNADPAMSFTMAGLASDYGGREGHSTSSGPNAERDSTFSTSSGPNAERDSTLSTSSGPNAERDLSLL